MYNSMLLSRIEPEIERAKPMIWSNFASMKNYWKSEGKKSWSGHPFCWLAKGVWLCASRKNGGNSEILKSYRISGGKIAAIIMLYENTKAMARFPYGNADFFNVLVVVLQCDALAPFLLILSLHCFLRTSVNPLHSSHPSTESQRQKISS